MSVHRDPNHAIAAQIDAISSVLEERAAVLRGYAAAIREDASLRERLADQYAGGPAALQILQEVGNRSKQPDLYHLEHTTLNALAKAQRIGA